MSKAQVVLLWGSYYLLMLSSSHCAQVLRLEPHIMVSNRTGIPLQVMHFNDRMQQTFDDQAGGATHPQGAAPRHLDIPAGACTALSLSQTRCSCNRATHTLVVRPPP